MYYLMESYTNLQSMCLNLLMISKILRNLHNTTKCDKYKYIYINIKTNAFLQSNKNRRRGKSPVFFFFFYCSGVSFSHLKLAFTKRSITFIYSLFLGTTAKGRQQYWLSKSESRKGRDSCELKPLKAEADSISFPNDYYHPGCAAIRVPL